MHRALNIFIRVVHVQYWVGPFSAKPIFGEKKKVLGGNFITTLVFMIERNLVVVFFFSQMIGLFHRTMKKKKSIIKLDMRYLDPNLFMMMYDTSCGAERVKCKMQRSLKENE